MISVELNGKKLDVSFGTSVGEVIRQHWSDSGQPPLAAIVYNRAVDLDFPVTAPCKIVPIDYTMRDGVLIYRRSAMLMLLEAVRRLWGNVKVSVDQAHGRGYAYRINFDKILTRKDVQQLDQQLKQLVEDDIPLIKERVSLVAARNIFSSRKATEKLRLLKTWWRAHVTLVYCGEVCDIHHFPVVPSTSCLKTFELVYRPPGLIFRFPPRGLPRPLKPFTESPKLDQACQETAGWLKQVGVSNIGQLNELIVAGEAGELIRITEGLHEKKIAQIADQICNLNKKIRLVLIAGPSSSGKTTFSKRVCLQLRVNGVRPVALSTDNFYVNRTETPLDEDDKYDFESIDAIDLDLFNDVLAALMRGEKVATPRFDFTTGMRIPKDKWDFMQLEEGQVLLVEGIHGLNPRLTEAVAEDEKFKIYISALTQLCIDDYNRLFTSDTRFVRRIVRDRLFRGYSATDTIEAWPRVRRGEMRNIYPFQEEADAIFNSALVYEHAVLKPYVERYLLEVSQDHPAFSTAYRLLRFFGHFVPIFNESIPQTSLLREFIGGSFFDY